MLASSLSKKSYTGNGSTSTYQVPFRFFLDSDIVAITRTSAGVETTLVYGVDYTLSGAGMDNGGYLTLTAGALASGTTITIKRIRPYTQGSDFRNQSKFYGSSHDDALDHCTMLSQQLRDDVERSVKMPESVSALFDPTLPSDADQVAGATKVLALNGTVGSVAPTGFQLGPTIADIANAATNAALAQAAVDGIDSIFVNIVGYGATSNATFSASEADTNLAAFNSAIASGKKLIYVPAGTYWVSGPIEVPYDVSIVGDGRNASIIRVDTTDVTNWGSPTPSFSPSIDVPIGVFNFQATKFSALPALAFDIAEGASIISFSTAHGLKAGDIVVLNNPNYKLTCQVTAGSIVVGQTLTGGTSSATGTVLAVEEVTGSDGNTYAYVDYEVTSGSYQGFTGTETITGSGTGSSTSTLIRAGGSYAMSRDYYQDGEFYKVASAVTDTQIEIYGCSTASYDRGFHDLYKLEGAASGSISGLKIIGPAHTPEPFTHGTDTPVTQTYPYGISIVGGHGFSCLDVEVVDFYDRCVQEWLSFGSTYDRCIIGNHHNYGSQNGLNYGLALISSCGGTVRNSHISGTRHAITTGSGGNYTLGPNPKCMHHTVQGCFIRVIGGQLATGDHDASYGYSYIGNIIHGGGVGIGGDRSRFVDNDIYTGFKGTAIYMSSPVGTDHLIEHNRIFSSEGYVASAIGAIRLYAGEGTYRGVVRDTGVTRITGNVLTFKKRGFGMVMSEFGADPGTGTTWTMKNSGQTWPFSGGVGMMLQAANPADGSDRSGGPYSITSIGSGTLAMGGASDASIADDDVIYETTTWNVSGIRFMDGCSVDHQDAWRLQISDNTFNLIDNSVAIQHASGTPLGKVYLLDFSRNTILGGAGMKIAGSGLFVDRLVVRQNYHDARGEGSWAAGPDFWLTAARNAVVENNIIRQPYYGAIYLALLGGFDPHIVRGNICHDICKGGFTTAKLNCLISIDTISTAWSGTTPGVDYTTNSTVTNGGEIYRCIAAHNSFTTSGSEPGAGGSWTSYWKVASEFVVEHNKLASFNPTNNFYALIYAANAKVKERGNESLDPDTPGGSFGAYRVTSGAGSIEDGRSVTLTNGTHDGVDVHNIDTIVMDASSGNVILQGLKNGRNGQVLDILAISNSNDSTIQNNASSYEDILLSGNANETKSAARGGWRIKKVSGTWYEVS